MHSMSLFNLAVDSNDFRIEFSRLFGLATSRDKLSETQSLAFKWISRKQGGCALNYPCTSRTDSYGIDLVGLCRLRVMPLSQKTYSIIDVTSHVLDIGSIETVSVIKAGSASPFFKTARFVDKWEARLKNLFASWIINLRIIIRKQK